METLTVILYFMKQILLLKTLQTLKSPVLFCRYCISVILMIMSLSSTSQTALMYAKSIGSSGDDQGRAVLMDASGNVYSAGYFSATADFDPGAGTYNLTSSGNKEAYVCKLGSTGNFIWAKKLGGTGDDQANAISIDASGNLLVTGTFTSTADFDPNAGTFNLTAVANRDIFICKLDASGSFLWAKQIGGSAEDEANSIAVDAAGNVFTTGSFQSSVDFNPGAGTQVLGSSGGDDIFISSLDASGNHRFARKMGGSGNEYGNAIKVDGSGNIITAGIFNASGDYDPSGVTFTLNTAGGNDIFISKLNSTGVFVWARSIGSGGTDVATALILSSSGDVYTTGYFENTVDFNPGAGTFNITSSGGTDVFVHKLDLSGNFLWAVRMGGTGNEQSHAILQEIYLSPVCIVEVQLISTQGPVCAISLQ
jgi:hypothetical protein